ncbi:hypothetical protein OsJ_06160 [Oryza sativa Japonica Group]|uniref:Uncharacterized protein n=1 Tax=Oryza sativa subsp. japonica TaxID=39947 RepID=A3A5A9_ORYSJ|nr:hypothetical protein OsJ_06160 [Oryza sativa Japonica Group]
MARAPLPNSLNEETAVGTSCGHAVGVRQLCREAVAMDTCAPEEVENAASNGTAAAAAGGEQPGAVARLEQRAAGDEAAARHEPGTAARGEKGEVADWAVLDFGLRMTGEGHPKECWSTNCAVLQ